MRAGKACAKKEKGSPCILNKSDIYKSTDVPRRPTMSFYWNTHCGSLKVCMLIANLAGHWPTASYSNLLSFLYPPRSKFSEHRVPTRLPARFSLFLQSIRSQLKSCSFRHIFHASDSCWSVQCSYISRPTKTVMFNPIDRQMPLHCRLFVRYSVSVAAWVSRLSLQQARPRCLPWPSVSACPPISVLHCPALVPF